MRKKCVQTYEKKSLAQKLTRGGFRKTGKKVLASVLAVAMVLTSGVVIPQNSTVAEAAEPTVQELVTTDWWSGIVSTAQTLAENSTATFYVGSVTGGICAVELRSTSSGGWTATSTNNIWSYGGVTDNGATFTGAANDDTLRLAADTLYSISVERGTTDYTISFWDVTNNQEWHSFTASNVVMGDGDVPWVVAYPQGGTYLVSTENFDFAKKKVTINCVDEEGNALQDPVVQEVYQYASYSIEPPAIDGYTTTATTLSGTMGAEDITETYTYTSAASYTLTVKYVDGGGYPIEGIETVTQTVDEGKIYSVKSPSVAGMAPDITTVTGTMGAEDREISVQYKNVIATVGSDAFDTKWDAYDSFYPVIKKAGDFSVSFSFHNDSAGANVWTNYAIALKDSNNKLWHLRSDPYSISNTFGDAATITGGIGNNFEATVKDSEVGVSVVREGTTITITNSVVGANGETVSWTATSENCSTDITTIYLGCEAAKLSIYNATESDEFEEQTVTVHYVDESGKTVAEDVIEEVEGGQTYSIKSPAIAGYAADKTTVAGTMADSAVEVTVTYKAVIATLGTDNGNGTYTQGFADTANYYSVIKKPGDFDVSFSFHNDSPGTDNWLNYMVVCNSESGLNWTSRADMYAYVSDWSGTAFGQPVVYSEAPDWTAFKAMAADAEVGVTVSRSGSTMTMTHSLAGANGTTFSWTATVENCPEDMMTIYLGGDCSMQSLYSATASDAFEKQTVTVHYVNASGKTVAEDAVEEVEGGQTYSITSPVINGYVADKKVVSGTVGAEPVEITVTYKKAIATVGTDNGDGTYTLGYNAVTSYYPVLKSGDFDVSFSFHNNSAGDFNWNNYAIVVRTASGSEWYERADRWSNSVEGNTAFGGNAVSYEGGPDWGTFADTIKDAEVNVTVSRKGTTMTISHSVVGGNGVSYSWTSSVACPLDTMTVYLGGEQCKLDVYAATESDNIAVEAYPVTVKYVYEDGSKAADDATLAPLAVGSTYYVPSPEIEGYTADMPIVSGTIARAAVNVTVTYKPEKTEPIGSIGKNEDGSFNLGFNDLGSYYDVEATGDFELNFQFHQEAPGDVNWNSYAVVVKNAAGSEWYHRADLWSVSGPGNTAFGGQPVTYSGGPNWDTFLETMKEADCSVKVVRTGSTMTMTHSVVGANGVSYAFTSTVTNCPTDDVTVWLGGEKCALTIYDASIKGQTPSAPTEAPADPTEAPADPTQAPADPTEAPADPTQAPADPTEAPADPTEAPADPTKAPEKGDKVTNSNGSYKVTDTADKTVKYVADKDNKKSVTVSNTVKVNGKNYKVTAVAKNAFKGNTKVTKVTIGKNVTKIEANAFKNCKNLKTIVIKSTKLTSVAKNALKGTNAKLVIKVPAKKVAAYTKLFAGKGNNSVVVKKA